MLTKDRSKVLEKNISAGVVTKNHADINQLSLSMCSGHLAQRDMNQSSTELTVSRILQLTAFSLQLEVLGLICYSVLRLQCWCKHLIRVGVQYKCTSLVWYSSTVTSSSITSSSRLRNSSSSFWSRASCSSCCRRLFSASSFSI